MSKRSFLHYWLQNQFGEAFWKVKVGVPGLWSYIYMGKEEVPLHLLDSLAGSEKIKLTNTD